MVGGSLTPRPVAFDAMHWLADGTADDLGVTVGELDGEGGVDQHGDGLVLVGAAQGDLLAGDRDHSGGRGPPLHPDRFGRGPWCVRTPRFA
jgi:hypothetical protein